MTALDIIVILLVGLGLFTGVRKGFVYAVLSLASWVLVVLALWAFHGPLAGTLERAMAQSGAYVLSFVIIFAAAFFGGKLIASQVAKGVRGSVVGPADRLLGAGFGALKGLVYATLFYMACAFVYDTIWGRSAPRPNWVRNAITYPLIDGTAKTFVDLSEGRQRALEKEQTGDTPTRAPAKSK